MKFMIFTTSSRAFVKLVDNFFRNLLHWPPLTSSFLSDLLKYVEKKHSRLAEPSSETPNNNTNISYRYSCVRIPVLLLDESGSRTDRRSPPDVRPYAVIVVVASGERLVRRSRGRQNDLGQV